MVLNSLVEMASHDMYVKRMLGQIYVGQSYGVKQKFLADLIGRAKHGGEITIEQEPERLVGVLMMTLAEFAATVKGFQVQSMSATCSKMYRFHGYNAWYEATVFRWRLVIFFDMFYD